MTTTGWGDTITVDTVSDVGVEVCVFIDDGKPTAVSVVGSTSALGSHRAVEDALGRLGWAVKHDNTLNGCTWELGEKDDEEVCFLGSEDITMLTVEDARIA